MPQTSAGRARLIRCHLRWRGTDRARLRARPDDRASNLVLRAHRIELGTGPPCEGPPGSPARPGEASAARSRPGGALPGTGRRDARRRWGRCRPHRPSIGCIHGSEDFSVEVLRIEHCWHLCLTPVRVTERDIEFRGASCGSGLSRDRGRRSRRGSSTTTHAGRTWRRCAGLTDSCARRAARVLCVGDSIGPMYVRDVRSPDLGHRGHDLSSEPLTAARVVRSDLVRVRAEERGVSARSATRARVRLDLRPRGRGCTSFAARWCFRDRDRLGGDGVASRSTAPSSARAAQPRQGLATPTSSRSSSPSSAATPGAWAGFVLRIHRHPADRQAADSPTFVARRHRPRHRALHRRRHQLQQPLAEQDRRSPTRTIALDALAKIPPTNVLPAVHRVASLLKRWIVGTLHDRQSAVKHLRLLPRRVHLPLQPPHQPLPRPAVLPPPPAGRQHRPTPPAHQLYATQSDDFS